MATESNNLSPCWCCTAVIPRELLERVPEAFRDKTCICRDCIERFAEERTGTGAL